MRLAKQEREKGRQWRNEERGGRRKGGIGQMREETPLSEGRGKRSHWGIRKGRGGEWEVLEVKGEVRERKGRHWRNGRRKGKGKGGTGGKREVRER